MTITVLVENATDRPDLLAEHGLSLWIERGGKRILFDTGQGAALGHNARRLGVRLETVDAVVLSHGHYDHTGGLRDVLHSASRARLYAHPAALEPKYAGSKDRPVRSIGTKALDEQALGSAIEFVAVRRPTDVGGGLMLTGPIPRTTDFEDTGGPFFTDAACTSPDELVDDLAAFIETPTGTIVILGCAHAGIINTLRYIQTLTAGRRIHTVIGGMHLLSAGTERIDKTLAELRRLDIPRLLPCHCTGSAVVAQMAAEFGAACAPCPVGTKVTCDR